MLYSKSSIKKEISNKYRFNDNLIARMEKRERERKGNRDSDVKGRRSYFFQQFDTKHLALCASAAKSIPRGRNAREGKRQCM